MRHRRLAIRLVAAPCVAALLVVGSYACAPRAVTRLAERAWPGCVYELGGTRAAHERLVALTIDDAPDTATTPALLDTLARHGARATFFAIGERVPGAEHVVARLVREGHELGNHFMTSRPTVTLDSAALERDLAATHARLAAFGPVRWARPGSGWYTARLTRQVERAGYRCALGSVYPLDAELPWPWMAERWVASHARPGAIVILHDGGGRGRRTARVLGHVLPALAARGYRVVPLSELAGDGR